jgi:hypothetical protein
MTSQATAAAELPMMSRESGGLPHASADANVAASHLAGGEDFATASHASISASANGIASVSSCSSTAYV